MTVRHAKWLCLAFAAALWLSAAAVAQHGGGPPGGGGGQGPGGQGPGGSGPGGMNGNGPGGYGPGGGMPGGIPAGGARGGVPGGRANAGSAARAGLGGAQLGPVGRWWDDKGFARSLNLRQDQKQRMDAVFNSNRAELMGRYQELKTQETKLEEATRETRVNGGSVFAQINRVAEAREALGAVNARMTEALRKELDPGQLEQLQHMK